MLTVFGDEEILAQFIRWKRKLCALILCEGWNEGRVSIEWKTSMYEQRNVSEEKMNAKVQEKKYAHEGKHGHCDMILSLKETLQVCGEIIKLEGINDWLYIFLLDEELISFEDGRIPIEKENKWILGE
jgi:hypothetical protein